MSLYAIRFEFDSRNFDEVSLKKEVRAPGDGQNANVSYFAMACPVYYKWKKKKEAWKDLGDKAPTYKRDKDKLVFVFNDAAAGSGGDQLPTVAFCGAAIEFAQGLAPFDDDVTASIRMTATQLIDFPTTDSPTPLSVFALDWTAALQNPERLPILDPDDPLAGFQLESAGKFDYTVSLLTFFQENAANPKRYWQDPEMDIDN